MFKFYKKTFFREVLHIGEWNLKTKVDCEQTRLGSLCSPPHVVAGVEEITVHPQYNRRAASSDDIALIRLNISVTFDSK